MSEGKPKPRTLLSCWPQPRFKSNMLGAKPGKPIELRQVEPPWAKRLGSKLKGDV